MAVCFLTARDADKTRFPERTAYILTSLPFRTPRAETGIDARPLSAGIFRIRAGQADSTAPHLAPNFEMLPGLRNALPHCEVMDGAQVERIDAASMDILENVGVHFRDAIAIAEWKRAGAKVVDETVYLDRGLVRELIATIPADFTYHASDRKKKRRPWWAAGDPCADDRRALSARSGRSAAHPDAG